MSETIETIVRNPIPDKYAFSIEEGGYTWGIDEAGYSARDTGIVWRIYRDDQYVTAVTSTTYFKGESGARKILTHILRRWSEGVAIGIQDMIF